jgi:hypothetical protein
VKSNPSGSGRNRTAAAPHFASVLLKLQRQIFASGIGTVICGRRRDCDARPELFKQLSPVHTISI